MRINCPICGERDRREFYYRGAVLTRPDGDAPAPDWDDYLHLRDNPAGPTWEYWQHEAGCTAWLEVQRNTVTHDILAVRLAGGDHAD